MTPFIVKGVIHYDKPMETYHLTLQFPVLSMEHFSIFNLQAVSLYFQSSC